MKNEIEKDIIPRQTVAAIVDNVDQAMAEVDAAFANLRSAKNRLFKTLGRSSYYDSIIDGRLTDYDFEEAGDKAKKKITRNAWRYIIEQTGLVKYMTEKRNIELEEQIEKNALPSLTVENVFGTILGLAGRMDGLLKESIKEVFDWLRPRNNAGVGELKTNKRFRVGYKVIIGYAVENNHVGGYRFQYRSEMKFTSLANVFTLLDGKGVQQSPHDFVTRCKEAMNNGADRYEDEYFKATFYQNGRMHIQFKRKDLLDELNRIGGGGELPGHEQQTKREAACRAVVVV